MTHLKIEQNNGVAEEVSSNVITKLYNIVHSNNLDGTSKLKGKLHTTVTYQDYIDYLQNAFEENGEKLLIIESSKIYMLFADPIVANYWANSAYGDGTGIDTTTAATNVSSIPRDAFKNNSSIQTFNELGDFINCTSIGPNAFYHCSNLTNIDLSNITFLDEMCFESCISLTSINTFNSLLTRIILGAFSGCLNLVIDDIILPNLISLLGYAFNGTKVKLISNLGSITTIDDHAFNNCGQLTSVTLPNTVRTILDDGFYNCSLLTTINLSNVTTIAREALNGCSLLTSIDLSGCTSIGNSAFQNCTSLTSVGTLNSLLANIPDWCFAGCSSLASFDFSNITSIGYNAFDGCTSLTSIDLSGVTLIKGGYLAGAFLGCTSLTTVSGLNNPKYLYPFIFYLCTSLGTNLNLVLSVLNPNSNSSTAVNIGYAFFETKYKNVEIHSLYTLNLGYAFSRCNNLEKIDLSDINGLATTDICYYSSVLTIILPANNIPMIDYRFAGNDCPNLTKIIILSSTPPSLETTSLDTVWKTTCKIYVPNPLVYQSTPGWSTILDRIFSLSHPDLNDITWYTKSNS